MAIDVEALRTGGGGTPARPLVVSRARTSRRLLLDKLASRVVILGGMIIIASVLAILIVIVGEVWPLFRAPSAARVGSVALGVTPAPGPSMGVDEYREIAYAVTEAATLQFTALRVPGGYPPVPIPGLEGARVTATAALGSGRLLVGTSDGRVVPLEVKYQVAFKDGARLLTPEQEFGTVSVLDVEKRAILRLAGAVPQAGPVTVGQVGPAALLVQTVVEKKALIGAGTRQESIQRLDVPGAGEITALALDARGDDLFVGTSRGQILRYDFRLHMGGPDMAPHTPQSRANPALAETVDAGEGAAVTVLDFLVGDRTLVVGTQAGRVTTWQVVPGPLRGTPRLTRIHEFQRHAAPITAAAASRRDKGFATADALGGVHVNYGTSGQTLFALRAETPGVRAMVFAPKADGVLAVDGQGRVSHWRLDNPHPEITLQTLFGRVWYEGYAAPEYVWQSTGGTDDFEAKFSLTPLLYGTLKGTLYALLIAVPLALLAALYASEFMHPEVKAYVKPVVEIMAALPSVVLGFLAGLWLAPIVELVVPGLFLFPLVLTGSNSNALRHRQE